MIAIQAGRSQAGFTERQIAELNTAAAHLRRVLTLRGKLVGRGSRFPASGSILDAFSEAALIVSRSGQVLEANGQAEKLLSEGRVLHVQRGRICASQGDENLLAAILRACDPRKASASLVPLGRSGFRATVSPVKDRNLTQHAMLLVHCGPAPSPASLLKSRYGLTEAEAAIATRLTAGASIADIAEERGVSTATVRTQVRAVSGKMGCHRQTEIVIATVRLLGST